MTDEKIDLSPLDPTTNRRAFDATVRGIAREAMAARRQTRIDAITDIARWTRPVIAAAVLIAAVATLTLVSVGTPPPTGGPAELTTDVAGIPQAIVDWTYTNYHPSPLEIVRVLGRRQRGDQ